MAPTTFVLIPGAFHTDASFSPLHAHLQKAGFASHSTTLPSVGNGQKSLSDDVAHLRDATLLPLFDSSTPDVVLVLHSYAGIPGSAAIKGLSVHQRASRGQRGGVVGVVYMTAMVPKAGQSLLDLIGGQLEDWHRLDERSGLVEARNPKSWFYNDVVEPLASEVGQGLLGHSLKAWQEPTLSVGYADPPYRGRVAYIRTAKDQAIVPGVQEQILEGSGVEWVVREMDTGHSPFLVAPEELAGVLAGLAGEFGAAV